MITREDAARLREQLLDALREDARNTDRLVRRLDALTWETGVSAHAALLLILTRLAFDEVEARTHWEAILRHRSEMAGHLGRDIGLRVAIVDYFVNVNRRLVQPTLIDLELLDEAGRGAGVDALTGLSDERAFRGAVQAELRRARRYGQRVSVVLFDADDFRDTRDRAGALVADRLLREVAILLGNKIRDIDLAARPGDDEFALLLPQTDRLGATLVAERCRREIEAHFGSREAAGRPASVRLSAGLAAYPDDAKTPDALLARAAQALYEAKASGKNVVRAYLGERRRYLRFEPPPESCEVEVVSPRALPGRPAANLGPGGVLLPSPEPLDLGDEVELRVGGSRAGERLSLRGRVVRVEELSRPAPEEGDPHEDSDARFELGIAFLASEGDTERQLLDFVERLRIGPLGERSP